MMTKEQTPYERIQKANQEASKIKCIRRLEQDDIAAFAHTLIAYLGWPDKQWYMNWCTEDCFNDCEEAILHLSMADERPWLGYWWKVYNQKLTPYTELQIYIHRPCPKKQLTCELFWHDEIGTFKKIPIRYPCHIYACTRSRARY